MSDLDMTITAEEQNAVEAKLLETNGSQLVIGYCSIASDIVSKLLTAERKPVSLEESLAILNIYENCVKKIFGVDPAIVDLEKMKAYRNFQAIIKEAEDKAAQELASQMPLPEMPESSYPADATPVEAEDVEVIPPEAPTEIDAAVDKVDEAIKSAEAAVVECAESPVEITEDAAPKKSTKKTTGKTKRTTTRKSTK